ncbi:hypothetical protein [Thioclava atlantica]|uniref:Uncharacterized protein n=1 Tax=Thioclava atlantica TaxID=1317124 RepID=A0A085TRT5_9RHOB|nr:hypothetical protein [Thioclava atlantica]KFE33432.1 hypothetical protein DW2_17994 [Thioclava atlantica]
MTGIWKSGNHLVYSALNELGIEGPFNGIAAHLLFGRGKTAKRLLRGSASGIVRRPRPNGHLAPVAQLVGARPGFSALAACKSHMKALPC